MNASAASKVIGSGEISDTLNWSLTEDGVLTISGTGDIPDMIKYKDEGYDSFWPWKEWYDKTILVELYEPASSFIKKVVIKEGVTGIGNAAFKNLIALTEVILPESLERIGREAFDHCYALKKIEPPLGLEKCDCIFADCPLEYITLPGCYAYQHVWLGTQHKSKVVKMPAMKSVTWLNDPYKTLTDIYYPGNEASWKKVEGSSQIRKSVTMHYYYNSTKFYNCTATISQKSYSYTGNEVKPTVTVRTAAGTKLLKGTNYTVSYANNDKSGIGTITVTPIGKYFGEEKNLAFNIKPMKVQNLEITKSSDTEVTIRWDANPHAQKYLVYNGSLGTTLTRTDKNTYIITGLKATDQYRIWVYAIEEQTDEKTGKTVEYFGFSNSVYIHK